MVSGSVLPVLSISVVTYAPDLGILGRTLSSLNEALSQARSAQLIGHVSLYLVDNGPGMECGLKLRAFLETATDRCGSDSAEIISGHGNVGYGKGHNLAILRSSADYHLVLNPDVILDPQAIGEAARFMTAHDDVGLITPAACGVDGQPQYLCKRYPAVTDLLLRGFAPRRIQDVFRSRLDCYEMKSRMLNGPVLDIPIASGSFMFLRRRVLEAVGSFSDAYFMYFEDFDLSIRISRASRIAYVPSVKIVHLGGNAAAKGWRHIAMFIRSLFTFYRRHGWKLC